MERSRFVLAAMSSGGSKAFFPVQVQKLLFLLDENTSQWVDGPYFEFEPHDYGPFDSNVYRELEQLRDLGFVEILPDPKGIRTYRLTDEGREKGREAAEELPTFVSKYAADVVKFVLSLSFSGLVSAIYRAYPDMKVNSVFAE